MPTRALGSADQLLHVLAHGARWGEVPPIRWVADAVAVERSAEGGLDWERFVAEASRRHLTVAAAEALERLAADLDFPVPGWALAGSEAPGRPRSSAGCIARRPARSAAATISWSSS